MGEEAGFREIDHTADWQLEVWAPDFEGLLGQAAAGMYEMSGVECGSEREIARSFEFEGEDRETLLVQFLSELVYAVDAERLAFRDFDVSSPDERGERTVVDAVGAPVSGVDKEIKAVTWHELSVAETECGYGGRVTFDV